MGQGFDYYYFDDDDNEKRNVMDQKKKNLENVKEQYGRTCKAKPTKWAHQNATETFPSDEEIATCTPHDI